MRIVLSGWLVALCAGCSAVYTYSGTVVDGRGVPIELVRVEVVRQTPTPFASPKVIASTIADAEGRFRVEAPRRSSYLRIGGWEVGAAEASGTEFPTIALPAAAED